MRQSTIFALAALSALSAAAPLEKRDMLTVVDVVNVVETVDVTTTIFVPTGDPRLAAQQAAMNPQVPAQAPAKITTAAPAYLSPQTSAVATPQQAPIVAQAQEKEAAHPAPASSPAPAPAVVAPKPATVAAAPAVQKLSAPVQQQAPPIQQQAPPASSPSTPSTSTSNSGSSGGACGTKGGKCIAGDVTTFQGSGAAGSCGYEDPIPFGDNYFALAVGMMGSASNDGGVSTNPFCNRTADIIYNGNTYHATLTDKCMGCNGGDQSLDLSPQLFMSMFGKDTGNFHNIEWHFTSDPTI